MTTSTNPSTTSTTGTTGLSGLTGTAWMAAGACLPRKDLPWTADPGQVTPWQLRVMATHCQACPVLIDCAGFAEGSPVTAGFWAGRHRDPDANPSSGSGWATEIVTGPGALGGLGDLGGLGGAA